ncbi:AlpA family phage regulatory protein [Novosphingobium sp.]|uniref:AlpA family phage regulatory protein n=1 Tax=Novosphingobium sp. TaxID=1874826 RepID=UPI00333EC74E
MSRVVARRVAESVAEPVAEASETVIAVPAPPRLIRLPEVIARVGLKRSSIYQRMAEGRFPKGRSLGLPCVVWVEAEIDVWIAAVVQR